VWLVTVHGDIVPTRSSNRGDEYVEYLPESQLKEGCRRGAMFRGRIQMFTRDPTEAYIKVPRQVMAHAGVASASSGGEGTYKVR